MLDCSVSAHNLEDETECLFAENLSHVDALPLLTRTERGGAPLLQENHWARTKHLYYTYLPIVELLAKLTSFDMLQYSHPHRPVNKYSPSPQVH